MSELYLGTTHNKTIWDNIDFQFNDSTLFIDLSFKRIGNDYMKLRMPNEKKKIKKSVEKEYRLNMLLKESKY